MVQALGIKVRYLATGLARNINSRMALLFYACRSL